MEEELYNLNNIKGKYPFQSYKYYKNFRKIGLIIPDRENERIVFNSLEADSEKIENIVYIFTINGDIFKIGHTIKSLKLRIQSYNCGKKEYRKRGTCSTTNYKILQSFLNYNQPIEVYIYECPKIKYLNIDNKEIYVTTAKQEEHICIEQAKKDYGSKPMGCIQT